MTESKEALVNRIRNACREAAQTGYEEARISGLCEEGAIEAALSAIDMVDLEILLNE